MNATRASDIAVVGMALRVPGARTPAEYWHNLRNGVESIRQLSEAELLAAGVPHEVFTRPGYVPAAATLDRFDHFDAEFFGFSPREAAIMDPQHRQFLQTCWEALEDASHPPATFDGAIGVFAGCGMGSYFALNLLSNPQLVRDVGLFLLRHTGNDKDFLATRASYLLDLRGPSMSVQTACSTSLVAVHLAAQHLLSGECDMALAGGSTIELPHGHGYQYLDGEILSPDGHCRAFDAASRGTVFGSGAGVVALRRLSDALADGDRVYAVLRGSAVNNDGAQKVGYLAPSVDGQSACVAEALAVADVEPATLGFVECHGTGTPMGDPIEVAALTHAFRLSTDKNGFCAIGSVKTNIGHLDTAAGVAGFIKATLSLYHRELAPTLHYQSPNPDIDFANSPFFVNAQRREWRREGSTPRRAGVNSLGVGGTNAFVVLEEFPVRRPTESQRPFHLLQLSAKNRPALDEATARLAHHLAADPTVQLADVAWTLHAGRAEFRERRVVAAGDTAEAAALLAANDGRRVASHTKQAGGTAPSVAFLFPGGGAQYAGMARGLAEHEPVFRRHLDDGIQQLRVRHGVDLEPLLLDLDIDSAASAARLAQPSIQLPAIFVVAHAMARLLIDRGVVPDALLGHSLGENTAACIAGTIEFADCLDLVALRGRLLERAAGGMTAVPLAPDELTPYLARHDLDLAVVNTPDLSVASGPTDRLAALEAKLREIDIEPQRIKIDTAAHSRVLEPELAEYRQFLSGLRLRPPTTPWVSNVTGTWVTAQQATDPEYWVQQLRRTVQFSDGLATLGAGGSRVFVEVGPGVTLSSLARANPALGPTQVALPSLRHPDDAVADEAVFLTLLGRLWAVGATVDLDREFADERRSRVGLPTYAFQEKQFYIEPGQVVTTTPADTLDLPSREPDEARWWWQTQWRESIVEPAATGPLRWLVLHDHLGVGDEIAAALATEGHEVVHLRFGDSFQRIDAGEYVLAAELGADGYERLLRALVEDGRIPDRVLHLALLATQEQFRPGFNYFHRNQELGIYSLLHLAQAWAAEGIETPLHITVTTAGAVSATTADTVRWPEQATVLGPVMVLPHELAGLTIACVDIDPDDLDNDRGWRQSAHRMLRSVDRWLDDSPGADSTTSAAAPSTRRSRTAQAIRSEALGAARTGVHAFRAGRRLTRSTVRATLPAAAHHAVRSNAVVLVTGGLGGVGLTSAEHLATRYGARLALLTRSPLPDEALWDGIVSRLGADHPLAQRLLAVRRLRAAGAQVMVVDGDVTDVERMRDIVGQVVAHYGALHAVVHAAGVVDDSLAVMKSETDVERVLSPKVYGTVVLDEVTRELDLDLFVVYSSTSTVTAPAGQLDYVAANSFLNSFVASRAERGRTRFLAINWGVWKDTGMAQRAAMELGQPHRHAADGLARQPLFTTRSQLPDGSLVLAARWSSDDWFIDHHRTTAGHAVLPGSAYAEIARQALIEADDQLPISISNLVIEAPLFVADGTTADVQVRLTPAGDGRTFTASSGGRTLAEATTQRAPAATPAHVDLAAAQQACTTPGPVRSRQQQHLRFGRAWQVVDDVRFGDGLAIAHLSLPDDAANLAPALGVHPGLLDLATGFPIDMLAGYTGRDLWAPVSCESIVMHGVLPRRIVALATLRSGSEASGMGVFDAVITDTDGRVLVTVTGFCTKRLPGGLPQPTAAPEPASAHGATAHRPQSEVAFLHNLQEGIDPSAGVRMLDAALTRWPGCEVTISSLDVEALSRQAIAVAREVTATTPKDSGPVYERPTLEVAYEAPRSDVERTLVTLWQDLLGIDHIGIHDDFFELGGHSIVAVKLFAKLKRAFDVDLPMSVLFEAPTVAACAALIQQRQPVPAAAVSAAVGEQTDAAPGSGQSPTAGSGGFQYLVPMGNSTHSQATPLFVVAGMFGNVLNLRHLALQVANDRPFYGVQARGLFGGNEPHRTFEAMAADYLAEVRRVQPEGPYLLGGFSGGGIAAFEMARQLQQAGQQTALVVLLDTPAPAPNPALTARDKLHIHSQNMRADGPLYPVHWWRQRRAWQTGHRSDGVAPPPPEGALHSLEIEAAFRQAVAAYELRPTDLTLALFRPRQHPAYTFGPGRAIDRDRNFLFADNRWSTYCRRVDVVEVPGDHDSMVLEPNVRVLAAKLRQSATHALTSAS